MEETQKLILQGALEFGVEIDQTMLEKFSLFTKELLLWNEKVNLTAIKKPEEIALKHYVDSLAVLRYAVLKSGAKAVDVGCGAGFPGIPVKIARNDISLCCIDGHNKKLDFISQLVEKLELKDCRCVHARAEEAAAKKPFRASFDAAFARAVAKLRVLAEYCLPFVKTGGVFVALKGGNAKDEIAEALNAVKLCGGEIEGVYEYMLPLTQMGRTAVVIRKVMTTDEKYPRTNAKIAKDPL